MIDAIDERVARSKDHKELRAFHAFHRANPQILDFLVTEIRLRIDAGFGEFSIASLWHYCRWKLQLRTGPSTTYAMNDHLGPLYGRAIAILHTDLNGRAEMRSPCIADEIFGTRVGNDKRPGDYARRLEWADGTALEHGWRPSIPHAIRHAANRKPDIHERVGA
jgi:hypothetical protein